DIKHLSRQREPVGDHRIFGSLADIDSNTLSKGDRHAWRSKQANQSVKRKLGIPGLVRRLEVRVGRRPRTIGYGNQFNLACLKLRPQRGERCLADLNALGGKVVGSVLWITIRNAFHVQVVLFEKSGKEKINCTGGA